MLNSDVTLVLVFIAYCTLQAPSLLLKSLYPNLCNQSPLYSLSCHPLDHLTLRSPWTSFSCSGSSTASIELTTCATLAGAAQGSEGPGRARTCGVQRR